MTTKYKLDIKEVISNMYQKNYDWYDNLEPELQNEFKPFVIMQYLSTYTKDDGELLLMVNDYLNCNLSKMSKSSFYRACCAIIDTKIPVNFIKPPKGKKTSDLLITRLVSEMNMESYDDDEGIRLIEINQEDYYISDWLAIASSMNWPKTDVDKLEKELKQLKIKK